jgi:DnaJ-class molecular chaperone
VPKDQVQWIPRTHQASTEEVAQCICNHCAGFGQIVTGWGWWTGKRCNTCSGYGSLSAVKVASV